MKKVFICSPFRANSQRHSRTFIKYAKDLCAYAFRMGCAPFAPHLLYPDILYPSIIDDAKLPEREKGISAGLKFMAVCDEVWIGIKFQISEGMHKEIQTAKELHIPMYYIVQSADGHFSKHKV